MTKYVAQFIFSAQTGIETWAHVSTFLECSPQTTIQEIIEWKETKGASTPIRLELAELEQKGEGR